MAETVPEDPATPGSLTIQRSDDARGPVLTLGGELDLESAPELSRRLRELEEAKAGRVLIDLASLEFMDSSGLSVLVQAHRSAQGSGTQLALRPGPPQVQRLFELTGMTQRFTFED